jgi:hypothetical protein
MEVVFMLALRWSEGVGSSVETRYVGPFMHYVRLHVRYIDSIAALRW